MKRASTGVFIVCGIATALMLLLCNSLQAQIVNVVETGGDNEPTDTITAKWTGQTFPVSVAGEPTPSSTIGQTYTVGPFGNLAPSYVDRNHRYINDPGTGGGGIDNIPAYLVGAQYIMSGNDNRDNGTYRLDVTVSEGTSMSVGVSPDGRTLAIDMQGSIWTLPVSGGAARCCSACSAR